MAVTADIGTADIFKQYLHYAKMVWSFRWLALTTAFTLCLIGWTICLVLPDQYEVGARVFLETRSMMNPVLKGLGVEDEVTAHAARVMNEALLSRPNLEAVVAAAGLGLGANTEKDVDAIIRDLREDIKVARANRENIYSIVYKDVDPVVAKRVVEALLNRFVESVLGTTRMDTRNTKQFLDDQIKQYESRLVAAEERLKDFKSQHGGLTPQQGMGYFERLSQLETQLQAATLELKETINRRDILRSRMATINTTISNDVATLPKQSPLQARLQATQQQLTELELNYTPKHPDVINTRRILDELKAEYERELASASKSSGLRIDVTTVQNPAYVTMSMQLNEVEGQVVALQTRVQDFERRVEEMAAKVDTMPEIEAEFAKLNRDYFITKEQYENLVERREKTEITAEASAAEPMQFEVLEPPRVPALPVGPRRVRLASVTLLGGLGGGVGLAFLMSQLNVRIHTREQLKNFCEYPVLGTVSMVQSLRQRVARRIELICFIAATIALFLLYGGFVLAQATRTDLLPQLLVSGL